MWASKWVLPQWTLALADTLGDLEQRSQLSCDRILIYRNYEMSVVLSYWVWGCYAATDNWYSPLRWSPNLAINPLTMHRPAPRVSHQFSERGATFIHSLNNYLLSNYLVPGEVLNARNTTEDDCGSVPAFMRLTFQWREKDVMVNFTCQRDRDRGCSDIWLNIILGLAKPHPTVFGGGVFGDEINIWFCRLRKADHLICWRPK